MIMNDVGTQLFLSRDFMTVEEILWDNLAKQLAYEDRNGLNPTDMAFIEYVDKLYGT